MMCRLTGPYVYNFGAAPQTPSLNTIFKKKRARLWYLPKREFVTLIWCMYSTKFGFPELRR